jgi:Stage II sporulation protein E (SpoIIE)
MARPHQGPDLGKLRAPPAYLIDQDGELHELEAPTNPALGSGPIDPSYQPTQRQLHHGERLILVTNGTNCWREPLEDDATIVVMAID